MFVSVDFHALRHVWNLPRALAVVSIISHARNRTVNHTHGWLVVVDKGDNGREVTAARDELLCTIKWVNQPVAFPLRTLL